MNWNEKLLEKRKASGITMVALSAKTGIDQALISKYENGSRMPSDEHLRLLSDSLAMNYRDLRISYMAEKIAKIVEYETDVSEIFMVAEDRLGYLKSDKVFEIAEIPDFIQKKLNEADKLKEEWVKKKPLNKLQLEKLKEYFNIKYTYDSNKIEGNTLSLNETHLVVNEGITIGGKSMREHLEAINHSEAIDFVSEILVGKEHFGKRNLLEIHRLILKSIDNDNAGRYRNVPVRIAGSAHEPPQPFLIDKMMEDFFIHYEKQKRKLHPILLAAEMHERLATIHPFVDGNGRTSRLLMNMLLLQNGYTIAILKGDATSKLRYFKALETVQVNSDPTPFYELVLDCVIESLEEHLRAV